MKQLTEAYLTGVEDVDKYLIEKPNLLDDKTYGFEYIKYPFFRHLYTLLDLETYKQVLEIVYPEGYKAVINQYTMTVYTSISLSTWSLITHHNHGTDQNYEVQLLKQFTLSCIESGAYTEEIVNYLMRSPYSKPITKNFVTYLVKFTKNKELLEPLTRHTWYQVRQALAENGLFLDQLEVDRSKHVRGMVKKVKAIRNFIN